MTTITKEQAQKIIDAADEVITALAGTNDDVHPDNSTKMTQLYDDLNDHYAPPEVVRELARIALVSLTAEPVAWRLVDSPESSVTVTDNEKMAAIWKRNGRNVQPLYAAPPASERERIRREHAEWSDKTFGDVGPIGPLKHLSKEALEAAADPSDPLEWADMQFLLWDAQRRMGISDEFITRAMIEKLAVNKQREWPVPRDGEPRLHIKDMPAPVMPAELHPDTQNLAADFCTALAEKLYKAQLKYGYDADWKQDGWHTQCLSHFHQHIAKGDPRDVAAYCAFMWYHGWKTESVSGPVVPEEMPKGLAAQIVSLLAHNIGDKLLAQKIWNACRAVMLQSKYRDLSQPVDPQISEYEKIMGQAGNYPVIPDGWISCSERMPEDEQEVIVQNKLGYRYVSYFDEHSGLFFDMPGGNQVNCIEHILVTHWMPLPVPPQH